MREKILSGFIALTLLLTAIGCTLTSGSSKSANLHATTVRVAELNSPIATDMLFTNEYKYSQEDTNTAYTEITATIILADEGVTISGQGASATGSFVEITSGGTFVISGTLSDGQIAVNAPATAQVRLVLHGVDITSSRHAAIYCMQADKFIITLEAGTENFLTDAANYSYVNSSTQEPDAALFSKKDLSINGTGALTIYANFNNGIGTKDDLVIAGGIFNVTAAKNAIRGRDSLVILDGEFNIQSQNDGLQSNNDEDVSKGGIIIEGGIFNINAAHDAIQAETTMKISGGTFHIVSGGGNGVIHEEVVETDDISGSYKGMKSGGNFVIEGGNFDIDSFDDCIHSNSSIQILNGEFSLSSGDDGIHGDDNLLIADGVIDILTSYEGLEGKTITIDGGLIDIISLDDGINASDGSTANREGMGFGEPPGGRGAKDGGGRDIISIDDGMNASDDWVAPRKDMGFGEPPAGKEPRLSTEEPPTPGETPPNKPMGGNRPMAQKLDNGIELYINGGILKIDAGGDAMDSNGNGVITGGEIYINGPKGRGDEMLDADGTFDIHGGIVFGVTNAGGSSPSSSSTQQSLTAYLSEIKMAGTVITIKSPDDEELATFTPSTDFQSIFVSTPDLKLQEIYGVYLDGVQAENITIGETT